MLITPEDFLIRAKWRGVERSLYKAMMCGITAQPDSLDKAINDGYNVYFQLEDKVPYVNYYLSKLDYVETAENEVFTEAFKLLKLIAD